MPRTRSLDEIDALITLAREYCASLASFRLAQAEGRLDAADEMRTQRLLARMDERIALLKSNNELDWRRALQSNVISLAQAQRKEAQ